MRNMINAAGVAAPVDWWFGRGNGVANAAIGDGSNQTGVGAPQLVGDSIKGKPFTLMPSLLAATK